MYNSGIQPDTERNDSDGYDLNIVGMRDQNGQKKITDVQTITLLLMIEFL